ncbi:MAG: hypothetical protein ACR652_13640 [Methylocystis sp.]|uniref:hypothetical protein n=1 Tax=Methylocystis sp. TaxID=1911079 RepID=UPI003DA4A2B9
MANDIPQNLLQYVPANYFDDSGNLTVDAAQAKQVAAIVKKHVEELPEAERDLYISMITSPDFAPGKDATASDVSAALERLDAAMTSLETAGFLELAEDINALEKALIEHAEQSRIEALQQRLEGRLAAKNQLLSQADKMNDAASKLMNEAAAGLAVSLVGSALSIAGSFMSFVSSMKMAKKIKDLGDPPVDPGPNASYFAKTDYQKKMATRKAQIEEIEKEFAPQHAKSQALSSTGSGIQPIGMFLNTASQADSQKDQALASEYGAYAQDIQSVLDVAKSTQESFEEMINKIINSLKEINDSEAERMNSMTRV